MDMIPVGVGLAALGFGGTAIGIGLIFSKMIESIARQPEAESKMAKYVWVGFAMVESIALYGLVVALILLAK